MKILNYESLKRRASAAAGRGRTGGHATARRSGGGDRRVPAGNDAAVRQALLLQLALKALDRIITDYSNLTRRPPSYAALACYLDELERGPQPAPAGIPGASSSGKNSGVQSETPALLQPARATAA
jgi:hypothetical protein